MFLHQEAVSRLVSINKSTKQIFISCNNHIIITTIQNFVDSFTIITNFLYRLTKQKTEIIEKFRQDLGIETSATQILASIGQFVIQWLKFVAARRALTEIKIYEN